jgi:pectate lyase
MAVTPSARPDRLCRPGPQTPACSSSKAAAHLVLSVSPNDAAVDLLTSMADNAVHETAKSLRQFPVGYTGDESSLECAKGMPMRIVMTRDWPRNGPKPPAVSLPPFGSRTRPPCLGRLAGLGALLTALLLAVGNSPGETYEGYGALTQGALDCAGYETFRVKSLADSGPGTLRDAVSRGCRLVIFNIGGTIRLQSTLNVAYSYITIDGSTAPAPGITLEQPHGVRTVLEARTSVGPIHDVIIQHLRTIGAGATSEDEVDVWGLDGEAHPVYNIILDHMTGAASEDGIFDIWGRVYNVTISWSLLTDTKKALHLSRGENIRENISLHHNVFARNRERQIRIKYDSRADFVNNVVYGWGWFGCGAAGLNIDSSYSVDPQINVINNVFHHVPGLPCGGPDDAILYSGGGVGTSRVYMGGNIVPAGERDTAGTVANPLPVPAYARVTTHPASFLGAHVVPCVGTKFRTVSEQALLNEVARAIGGGSGACPTSPGTPVPAAPTDLRFSKPYGRALEKWCPDREDRRRFLLAIVSRRPTAALGHNPPEAPGERGWQQPQDAKKEPLGFSHPEQSFGIFGRSEGHGYFPAGGADQVVDGERPTVGLEDLGHVGSKEPRTPHIVTECLQTL